MNSASTAFLALAMSADAFAAAIGKGTALQQPRWREALRTGAIFGAMAGVMPIAGWALGSAASRYVAAWDHWIAFALLAALGLTMIRSGLRPRDAGRDARRERNGFWVLAATGFATSIDAMAVGIGLAFIAVDIVPVAAAIGAVTFVMVSAGVMLGRVLGALAGARAEVAGGLVLLGIGTAILVEHLGFM